VIHPALLYLVGQIASTHEKDLLIMSDLDRDMRKLSIKIYINLCQFP
jgi:hypothetical protein